MASLWLGTKMMEWLASFSFLFLSLFFFFFTILYPLICSSLSFPLPPFFFLLLLRFVHLLN